MKGSVIAINQEAREHGMSYGKYLALRAAQQAPAPGREGKITAKPKRSMPPGACRGLAEAREKMGLSQEEAAWRLGTDMRTISNWETGKNLPQGRLLPKLAQVYGLSPDKLARIFGEGKTSKSALGHALRQARLRAGLGVEEAARQMDVTASAVRQWETGKNRPSWKSQQKIARVYGLSMEEIFRLLEEAGS